jgi:regulator of RNase E activity RraA
MDLDIAGQILSRRHFRQNKIGGVVIFGMVRSGEVMQTYALFGAVRHSKVWLGNVRQGDS